MKKSYRIFFDSFFSMIFLFAAAILISVLLEFFIYKSPNSINEIFYSIILSVIFISCILGIFYLIKTFRIVRIDDTSITIKCFLLFHSKKIELSQLVNWEELQQKQDFIILYKKDLKKTTIYSMNCWNYESFKEQLEKVLEEKEKIELNYSNRF